MYLIHDNYEWKLGLVQNAASIQHVGHERDRIYATRRVHYVNDDGWI